LKSSYRKSGLFKLNNIQASKQNKQLSKRRYLLQTEKPKQSRNTSPFADAYIEDINEVSSVVKCKELNTNVPVRH